MSVAAPRLVPKIIILAPISSSCVSASIIFPLILPTPDWAKAEDARKLKARTTKNLVKILFISSPRSLLNNLFLFIK